MLSLSPSYSTANNNLLSFCERYHINRVHFMDLPSQDRSYRHRTSSPQSSDQFSIVTLRTANSLKEVPLLYCMVLHPYFDSPTYRLCCNAKEAMHGTGVMEVNSALLESILEGSFGFSVCPNASNYAKSFPYAGIRTEIWRRLLVHHPELFKESNNPELDSAAPVPAFSLSTPFFLLFVDGGASDYDMRNSPNVAEHPLINLHEYLGCLQRSIDIHSLFCDEEMSEKPLLLQVSTEATGEVTSDGNNVLRASSKSTKCTSGPVSVVALLNCELPPIELTSQQYRLLFSSTSECNVSPSEERSQGSSQQYPDIPILAVVLSSDGKLLVPHDQAPTCLMLLCTILTSCLPMFVDLGNFEAAAGGVTTSPTGKSTAPAHLIIQVLEGISKEFAKAGLGKVWSGMSDAMIIRGDDHKEEVSSPLPPIHASPQQVRCIDRLSLQGQEGFPVLMPFSSIPLSETRSSSLLQNILLVMDINSDVIKETFKLFSSLNSDGIISLLIKTLRNGIEAANKSIGNIASANLYLIQKSHAINKDGPSSVVPGQASLSNPFQVYGPHLSSSIAAIVMESPNEQFRGDVLTMLGIKKPKAMLSGDGSVNTEINISKSASLLKRDIEEAILKLVTEALQCNK